MENSILRAQEFRINSRPFYLLVMESWPSDILTYISILTHMFIKIFHSLLKMGILIVALIAQLVKNLPATQETLVRFLGWEDPLEKGKVPYSSILAWRIQ